MFMEVIRLALIKKCDVCGKEATSNNPMRKTILFFGKDVINGNDKFYQQEVDVCLDCRNELRLLTAKMEYEFVQNKKYSEIDKDSYNIQLTYEEVADIEPDANPKELGYYEQNEGYMMLTEDETVVEGKTYYIQVETYTDNPNELGWFEKSGIDYVVSEDTEVDLAKVYYEKRG